MKKNIDYTAASSQLYPAYIAVRYAIRVAAIITASNVDVIRDFCRRISFIFLVKAFVFCTGQAVVALSEPVGYYHSIRLF
jgi:hypothetical protein